MKPLEIRGLAKATCAWLAYKHITGFHDTLGEAMLAIPISEYLKTSTNWDLHSEVLYKQLGLPALPELSCDFAGTPTYGKEYRFILETKYLKSKAPDKSRDIAADLIRLSLPTVESLKRYFLLAGNSEYFLPGVDNFLSGCNLFGLRRGGGKYFNPKDEIQNSNFQKKFPQYKDLLSSERKHLLDFAYIQCGADEKILIGDDKQYFRVMIWSVGRSERSAADGLSETE